MCTLYVQTRVSCPGTPGQGQEQMSWDKLLCPGTSRGKKSDCTKKISEEMTRFPVLEHHFSVLEHHFPVLEHPFLLYPVLSRVPSRILAIRPVPFRFLAVLAREDF